MMLFFTNMIVDGNYTVYEDANLAIYIPPGSDFDYIFTKNGQFILQIIAQGIGVIFQQTVNYTGPGLYKFQVSSGGVITQITPITIDIIIGNNIVIYEFQGIIIPGDQASTMGLTVNEVSYPGQGLFIVQGYPWYMYNPNYPVVFAPIGYTGLFMGIDNVVMERRTVSPTNMFLQPDGKVPYAYQLTITIQNANAQQIIQAFNQAIEFAAGMGAVAYEITSNNQITFYIIFISPTSWWVVALVFVVALALLAAAVFVDKLTKGVAMDMQAQAISNAYNANTQAFQQCISSCYQQTSGRTQCINNCYANYVKVLTMLGAQFGSLNQVLSQPTLSFSGQTNVSVQTNWATVAALR
ncbi:hypothetical protein D1T48_gp25 [Thermoproteus tenax virus 1]|uniref:Uncharacterized 38.6 kDa protein n=1 Tax=Thermoproteus tenax virus 1 (strain KRA1) TaxID=10480 RepID=YORM_TTV1K|nr:hypothetical protein D1T48_gp25 [Thermoproteus tenax virus 1]P19297.1 RecName: Full=Uncharacterized 38.6 kDa protein [Thermoproteus tenax virus 1 (STRAIN KRA1)]CAA32993.1 unnamed protein product [Thermoproteus tenax virus 1]